MAPRQKRTPRQEILPRLRAAAVHIVESHGAWEKTNVGPARIGKVGPFAVMLRTPFQRFSEKVNAIDLAEARSLGIDWPKSLPFGLDLYRDRVGKVLHIEWDHDDRKLRVVTFRRGEWESELLALGDGECNRSPRD